MSNAMLTELLYCFCILSALLLVGTLLRGSIPVFQKLFLPASVIGGFVGLLIGPIIWQGRFGIPFKQEWITTWSTLPGILIVPVIASTPLGMKFAQNKGKSSGIKSTSNVFKTFAIIFGASVFQILIGVIIRQIFVNTNPELGLYPTFGYELSLGFAGGHGTAGVLGSYLRGLDLPYWEIAQGITTTTATFGLIGGMVIGIILINIAARRGQTALLSKPGDIPEDMAKGFQRDPAKQKSTGSETTLNSSIESLTFHLSIILAACGIAYILLNLVRTYRVPIINQIPIWPYALVVMFGINFLINKLGFATLIDAKTRSKIAGTLSDYAIVAAIASMPVHAILQYIAPILVLVILGFIFTYLIIFTACKICFDDCKFERAVSIWGTSCGVFLTGLMLLKICDSDYKLPVLNDFSIGFSMTSLLGFIMMPVTVAMMLNQGFIPNLALQLGVTLAASVVLVGAYMMAKPKKGAPAEV